MHFIRCENCMCVAGWCFVVVVGFCCLFLTFYYPATFTATCSLQRIYLHFWRVDAVVQGMWHDEDNPSHNCAVRNNILIPDLLLASLFCFAGCADCADWDEYFTHEAVLWIHPSTSDVPFQVSKRLSQAPQVSASRTDVVVPAYQSSPRRLTSELYTLCTWLDVHITKDRIMCIQTFGKLQDRFLTRV